MPAQTFQPTGASASNCPSTDSGAANLDHATIPAAERRLKISMIFDDDVSARTAEILIKRAVSDFEYNMQSFGFNDLELSRCGATAARNVSDTDILIVAVRDNRALPDHMQFWLGMCFGLREGDQEGLLVFLSAKGAEASPDSSLLDYLRTIAVIGRMEFISQQRSIWRVLTTDLVSAS